jgi:hypothetical protein
MEAAGRPAVNLQINTGLPGQTSGSGPAFWFHVVFH